MAVIRIVKVVAPWMGKPREERKEGEPHLIKRGLSTLLAFIHSQ